MTLATGLRVRDVRRTDAAALAEIEASHTGAPRAPWWKDLVERHQRRNPPSVRVGLVAEDEDGTVVGYLLGQVRAFEFGSEPCGWIYSVGVRRTHLRRDIASRLLTEACDRFARCGVAVVRTMVSRDDVAVLTFFRSNQFVAGPFVELERPLPGRARRTAP